MPQHLIGQPSRSPSAIRHTPAWLALLCGLLSCLGVPARAQETYRLKAGDWQAESRPSPDSPQGQLLHLRQLIAQNQPRKARTLATKWIKAHPDSPLLAEAYLLRGDSKFVGNDLYKALFDYEHLAAEFPASEHFLTALEREFEIAQQFAAGVKRKLWGMPIIPAGGEAEEIFIRIQERAPGSDLGERASLALADYYFTHKKMVSAADAYQLFLTNYPTTPHRQYAMLRLIDSSLGRFRGPQYDPTGLIDAVQYIRRYQREFPDSAQQIDTPSMLRDIDHSLALKLLYHGQWYEDRGEVLSASYMYRRLVQLYPSTPPAQQALDRMKQLGTTSLVPLPPPAPLAEPASPTPTQPRARS